MVSKAATRARAHHRYRDYGASGNQPPHCKMGSCPSRSGDYARTVFVDSSGNDDEEP